MQALTTYERIANGLGWFSIGLGVAEIVAPGTLARLIGIDDSDTKKKLIRSPLYGMRELAAGAGILTQSNPAPWLWSRVAGDLMDIGSLVAALNSEKSDKTRVGTAMAAVLGVTALDVVCAQQLSSSEEAEQQSADRKPKTTKTVTVNKSADEAYGYWRNFSNLPSFMKHLESVQDSGTGRTQWRAIGPMGKTFEWEAETLRDEPGREIAWRSLDGSEVYNSGQVRFERGPGGRGTIIRVELEYDPPGGAVGAAVAKLFWKNPEQMLDDDLRRFKQILETGEVVKSDASIHPSMHPAQPAAMA